MKIEKNEYNQKKDLFLHILYNLTDSECDELLEKAKELGLIRGE